MADYDDDFGSVAEGLGWGGTARIPIPGLSGLCVELSPKGFRPETGNASVLFVHDISGRRVLRLDYASSLRTGSVDYHWNKRHTDNQAAFIEQSPIMQTGKVSYRTARYFKYGSRTLLITGPAFLLVSIVRASMPPRRATQVIAGWAGAWVGSGGLGGVGEWNGNIDGPLGTTIAGLGGGIIGGDGYLGGAELNGAGFDWPGDTYFAPVQEIAPPQDPRGTPVYFAPRA